MSRYLDALLANDALDAEDAPAPTEIIVDKKTGQARQAGASLADGAWVRALRIRAEASLYVFSKAILGREYLTPKLHRPVCDFLQTRPPQRKGLLLPREHAKTTLVGHALPIHILLQPEERNIYFPGESGADQRIYLVGETDERSSDSLRVIKAAFEGNELIRALWPHRCWDNPARQSKKWNDSEAIIRRAQEWPDPSIRAIGVGGAVTGAHPSVLIKDDLVTIKAANSPTIMQDAIQWHVASRALINAPSTLEFIIGTRWAVNDLYEYIQREDPTVEWMIRAVVENGAAIYPEAFTLDKVAQLQREFGVLFPLLYMNSAADPSLVDFDMEMVRVFELAAGMVRITEDERDAAIAARINAPAMVPSVPTGAPLNERSWQAVYRAGEGFRLRG